MIMMEMMITIGDNRDDDDDRVMYGSLVRTEYTYCTCFSTRDHCKDGKR